MEKRYELITRVLDERIEKMQNTEGSIGFERYRGYKEALRAMADALNKYEGDFELRSFVEFLRDYVCSR